jgi:hypothetical protein
MIVRSYIPGEPLAENEYMLKIRTDVIFTWNTETKMREESKPFKTGFFSKLTKKGELPKAFEEGKHSVIQEYARNSKAMNDAYEKIVDILDGIGMIPDTY